MTDYSIKESMNPINANLVGKLNELQEKIGNFNGHQVSYIAGLGFRLEKAQNLAKTTSQDPTAQANLQQEVAVIESKLGKAATVVSEILQQMKRDGTWEKIEISSQRTYFAKEEHGKLKIVSQRFLDRIAKELGKGGFGVVSGDTRNIHDAIVKQAHATNSDALADLLNEQEILNLIHEHDTLPGVVNAPKAVVTINDKDVRLIGERFEQDLATSQWSDVMRGSISNLPQIFTGFGNMFAALKNLHARDIFHGDIKPENIGVFKKTPLNPFRLADWGGARQYLDNDQKFFTQGAHTPAYIPENLRLSLEEAKAQGNKVLFKSLLAKCDHFALARSLTESLLPQLLDKSYSQEVAQIFNPVIYEFNNSTYEFPTLPINFEPLEKHLESMGYTTPLISLLRNMFEACHPDSLLSQETIQGWVDSLQQMVTILPHEVPQKPPEAALPENKAALLREQLNETRMQVSLWQSRVSQQQSLLKRAARKDRSFREIVLKQAEQKLLEARDKVFQLEASLANVPINQQVGILLEAGLYVQNQKSSTATSKALLNNLEHHHTKMKEQSDEIATLTKKLTFYKEFLELKERQLFLNSKDELNAVNQALKKKYPHMPLRNLSTLREQILKIQDQISSKQSEFTILLGEFNLIKKQVAEEQLPSHAIAKQLTDNLNDAEELISNLLNAPQEQRLALLPRLLTFWTSFKETLTLFEKTSKNDFEKWMSQYQEQFERQDAYIAILELENLPQ